MHNSDELQTLLKILPSDLQQQLEHHPQCDRLIEVVLDLGRRPEARFPQQAEYLSEHLVTHEQLQACVDRLGHFGADNRAGIEQTLHRISAIRNRQGDIIGLTCRVGRAIEGTIAMIRDLVETGQSILMLGRPGVGKTTALREIARVLADDLNKRVVIIDTSNEIAGDGDVPHPAIGRARRMQVARPELQHQVMIEAVENHMPEVIVIDEIGTELEALAARTIAERGVQLVGTAHGNQLENLIKNPTLSDLVGGIQAVTLGDEEAKKRGSQKTVLERKAPPTFDIAVEMLERQRWVVHEQVAETIDSLLRGRPPALQVRTVNENNQVTITREATAPTGLSQLSRPVLPFARRESSTRTLGSWEPTQRLSLAQIPEASNSSVDWLQRRAQEERFLRVYPYGIRRQQIEHVIRTLNLPIALVRDVEVTDVVLALPSHLKRDSKLDRMIRHRQVPVQVLQTSAIPEITRCLRRLLKLEQPEQVDEQEMVFAEPGVGELDAIEKARLA